MKEFVEHLMAYLEAAEGVGAYLALAASAALEAVFPPFPGDLVSLFGAFLAFKSTFNPVAVFVATSLGSLAGCMVVYEFGRWTGRKRSKWPRFLRKRGMERAVDRVLDLFERRGLALLAINRFWPALRVTFFLAAGMAGLSRTSVIVYGGISSCAWHGVILFLGYVAGENFDALIAILDRYTTLAIIIGTSVILLYVAYRFYRRLRDRRRPPEASDPVDVRGETPQSAASCLMEKGNTAR